MKVEIRERQGENCRKDIRVTHTGHNSLGMLYAVYEDLPSSLCSALTEGGCGVGRAGMGDGTGKSAA